VARLDSFDITACAHTWFDIDLEQNGWWDRDLVDCRVTPPPPPPPPPPPKPGPLPFFRRPSGTSDSGGGGSGSWWSWVPLRPEPVCEPVYTMPDGSQVFDPDCREPRPEAVGSTLDPAAEFRAEPRRIFAEDIPVSTRTRVDGLLERLLRENVPVGLMTTVKSPEDARLLFGDRVDVRLRIALVELRISIGGDLAKVIMLAQSMGFAPLSTEGQKVRLLAPADPALLAPTTSSLPYALFAVRARQAAEAQARDYEAKLEALEQQLVEAGHGFSAMEERLAAVEQQLAERWPIWLKLTIILGVATVVTAIAFWLTEARPGRRLRRIRKKRRVRRVRKIRKRPSRRRS
jgi:hypothetical protein